MKALNYIKLILLCVLCISVAACDGDETIPAEIHIENQLTADKKYETSSDIGVKHVFTWVGTWTAQPTSYDIIASAQLGNNLYKFQISSRSSGNIYWLGQIRVLDHFSDFGEAEKRTASFNKLCEYLRDEPDYHTENKWVRIVLEQP